MKQGYMVVLHKNIPPELVDEAKVLCEDFINIAKDGYGTGYRASYFRRGVFGMMSKSKKLTLRRLSKNRRIFGAVPIDMVVNKDGSPVNLDLCMCPSHLGGTKVKMSDGPFKEENYDIVYATGEIKG